MVTERQGKIEYWPARTKKGRQWFFHARACNGKIVSQSEGYTTPGRCKDGIVALITVVSDVVGFEPPSIPWCRIVQLSGPGGKPVKK